MNSLVSKIGTMEGDTTRHDTTIRLHEEIRRLNSGEVTLKE